jgi:transcription antitermination factor NusG
MEKWYALNIRCTAERRVARSLSNKGYDPFLPTYKQRRYWSDRIKTVESPLFPGYLFCRFDVATRLPILTTVGVQSVVGTAGTPVPIDEEEIEAIRKVVHSNLPYEPYPYVSVGQFVRIKGGTLQGLIGFVLRIRNEHRLIVSVRLLMRSVAVEIDYAVIEPIKDWQNVTPYSCK